MIDRSQKILFAYLSHYSGLQTECYLMFFLNFINSTLISVCYFMPLYFVTHLKFNVITASMITSFYALGTIVGGIAGGKLADKISHHIICILSLVVQGLAFLTLPMQHSANTYAINLFILGLVTYSFLTTNYLWAFSSCKDSQIEKSKVINILETVSNIGLGLGALIIGSLNIQQLNVIFIVAGMILLIICIYVAYYTRQNKINIHQQHHQITSKKSAALPGKHSGKIVFYILICLFFTGFIVSQLSSTYGIYLTSTFPTIKNGGFGTIFALNTFLVVIFQIPVANWLYKFNNITIAGIGTFLLGLGMLILIYPYHFNFILFSCLLYTLGEILFFSVAQLICYDYASDNNKGLILGLYRMIYAASRVIGISAGGYIFQYMGSSALWLTCGTIGCACLLSSSYFKKLVIAT